MEKALVLIKPDAQAVESDMLLRLRNDGFKVLNKRRMVMTYDQAVDYLATDESKLKGIVVDDAISHLTSGPCTVLIVSRFNAIDQLKTFVGPPDINQAKQFFPTCLKTIYGQDSIRDAVAASSSSEVVEEEIRVFYPDFLTEQLPTPEASHQLLEEALYPVLTKGLTELCKTKPANPTAWLGQWLLDNNPMQPKVAECD